MCECRHRRVNGDVVALKVRPARDGQTFRNSAACQFHRQLCLFAFSNTLLAQLRAKQKIPGQSERLTFDDLMGITFSRMLGVPLSSSAAVQATVAFSDGGLGMRRAYDIAVPAFRASRVEARPFVRALFHGLGAVTGDSAPFLAAYDAGIQAA